VIKTKSNSEKELSYHDCESGRVLVTFTVIGFFIASLALLQAGLYILFLHSFIGE